MSKILVFGHQIQIQMLSAPSVALYLARSLCSLDTETEWLLELKWRNNFRIGLFGVEAPRRVNPLKQKVQSSHLDPDHNELQQSVSDIC